MLDIADPLPSQRYSSTGTSSSALLLGENQVGWDHKQHQNTWAHLDTSSTGDLSGNDASDIFVLVDHEAMDQRSRRSGIAPLIEDVVDSTLHYYRHLGPTAIAPGQKKVKLKIRQHSTATIPEVSSSGDCSSGGWELTEHSTHTSRVPIFDSSSGLPSSELLSHLLETFFEYYGDHFGFVSLPYLNRLIESGKVSTFLICSMSALSARFCLPEKFSQYFEPVTSGKKRERWEFSLPFLERAKTLLMPLLSIPSPDVVAGMLLLSWVEFGDNNEAGMWMFMGMSLRMAQELGLHRDRCVMSSTIGQSPANSGHDENDDAVCASASPLNYVDSIRFERSAHIVLFWCIFVQDTCLSSGTGRVPSIKRHEISIRLPEAIDIAIIQTGPGGVLGEIRTCVFPYTVRMMQTYAASIEFLNTESSDDCHAHSSMKAKQRMAQIERLQGEIIQTYRLIPEEIRFGAIFYQAAVESHQAGPYLLLHLFFHLQIAFLTQEHLAVHGAMSVAPDEASATSNGDSNPPQHRKSPGSIERKATEGLYRNAIKSITDLLTVAKLIDDRTLLASFFLNQSFFHAACAYIRDISHQSDTFEISMDNGSSAFPIPNESSPSMVLPVEDYHKDTMLPTGSRAAAESTLSYLSLIAKANYHFLRQSVKDMAEFYAGAGWVDAVLDQRETGLRDVDLSIVSDKISTFIRLHDLRGRHITGGRLEGVPIAASSEKSSTIGPRNHDALLPGLSSEFLADAELQFDAQAFYNEYMSTGETFSN